MKPSYMPIPLRETPKLFFDIYYMKLKKDENTNITASIAKSHIHELYQNHLTIFIDGSVLDDNNVGAAFVIHTLKVERFFFPWKQFINIHSGISWNNNGSKLYINFSDGNFSICDASRFEIRFTEFRFF